MKAAPISRMPTIKRRNAALGPRFGMTSGFGYVLSVCRDIKPTALSCWIPARLGLRRSRVLLRSAEAPIASSGNSILSSFNIPALRAGTDARASRYIRFAECFNWRAVQALPCGNDANTVVLHHFGRIGALNVQAQGARIILKPPRRTTLDHIFPAFR
ncbi:hypothetical protein [Brucella melitensis]|uniref:hypothetical protein n=1 Tax=Brucella melitensis TaxID=29459 RepID=UPI003D2D5645